MTVTRCHSAAGACLLSRPPRPHRKVTDTRRAGKAPRGSRAPPWGGPARGGRGHVEASGVCCPRRVRVSTEIRAGPLAAAGVGRGRSLWGRPGHCGGPSSFPGPPQCDKHRRAQTLPSVPWGQDCRGEALGPPCRAPLEWARARAGNRRSRCVGTGACRHGSLVLTGPRPAPLARLRLCLLGFWVVPRAVPSAHRVPRNGQASAGDSWARACIPAPQRSPCPQIWLEARVGTFGDLSLLSGGRRGWGQARAAGGQSSSVSCGAAGPEVSRQSAGGLFSLQTPRPPGPAARKPS